MKLPKIIKIIFPILTFPQKKLTLNVCRRSIKVMGLKYMIK